MPNKIVVNVYSVAAAGDDTSFQEKIYFVVVAVNAFCCFNRVLAILANHDAVIGFLNQFNRNFKNKMHSTFRQVSFLLDVPSYKTISFVIETNSKSNKNY